MNLGRSQVLGGPVRVSIEPLPRSGHRAAEPARTPGASTENTTRLLRFQFVLRNRGQDSSPGRVVSQAESFCEGPPSSWENWDLL